MKIYLLPLLAFLLTSQSFAEGDFSYDAESKSIVAKYLGKVILIKGEVFTNTVKGKKSKIEKGSKVFPGDQITTSKRSMVKIEMIDTTVITVAPRSEFKFDKWDYRTKADRDATFTVLKGKIRSHIKVKNKSESNLEYRVGSVSMGIRGTRILANAYTRKDRVRVSHVVVLSGKTEIYDKSADKRFKLEDGSEYISFLRPDGTILKQTESILSPARLKELKANDKNPKKYFKPFIPYITSKDLKGTSSTAVSSDQSAKDRNSDNSRRSTKKKSWKSILEKLNKRLDEDDD
jgi:hypothetical protein